MNIANPIDHNWCDELFSFHFCAYGDTQVYAWGKGWDSAEKAALDWLADNAPGCFGVLTAEDYDAAASNSQPIA